MKIKVTPNGVMLQFTTQRSIKKFFDDVFTNVTESKHFMRSFFTIHGKEIYIHDFFLPELVYIFQLMHRKDDAKFIYENTWMKDTQKKFPLNLSRSKIKKNFDPRIQLKPYQDGFLKIYSQNTQRYHLDGYILSFEQGLGKTITSLALMEARNVYKTIIICPKSIIDTVWKAEIDNVYKEKQLIWTPTNKIDDARFYIINYESVSKLPLIITSKIGIVIDESHNLRNASGRIYKHIYDLITPYKNRDVLVMSGTPIKATGKEIIPMLFLLDPMFNQETARKFTDIYRFSTKLGIEILRNRFGMITHRKTKEEVLSLPEKHYEKILVKIDDGKKYTLENVKKLMYEFIDERKQYYEEQYPKYKEAFEECLTYYDEHVPKDSTQEKDFVRYKKIVKHLEYKDYGWEPFYSDRIYQNIKWANQYEKDVIYPSLPNDLKKKYKQSKAVVKYVDQKIEGEYLGGLFNHLRAEMFSKMVTASDINNIVNEAEKKTICFAFYKNVLNLARKYFINNNFQPILVSGDTPNIKDSVQQFKEDPNINPLVASIKTLSTGQNLTIANTIIFLSPPWRDADKKQAEDRVHRIGQDSPVYIYDLVLDTGDTPNMSTRMEDIIEWSSKMFKILMGEEGILDESFMFENWMISQEDYKHKFDKWPNENKILFVVGLSASGKSTTGSQLAKEYNCKYIELDNYWIPLIKKYKKKTGKKAPDFNTTDLVQIDKDLIEILKGLIKNIKEPTVIEGVHILQLDHLYLRQCSLIIKNTSYIKSFYRALKRDAKKYYDKGLYRFIDHYRYYLVMSFGMQKKIDSLKYTLTRTK